MGLIKGGRKFVQSGVILCGLHCSNKILAKWIAKWSERSTTQD